MASFYLQYRPQRVADLDLEAVRAFFERILSSEKVAHAYLFTGPRGTGKTSAARILAKIVNCTRNEAVFLGKQQRFQEPCNTCVACKSITNGSMVDLIEIDAASNRGIDDIRDLREKIRLAPVGARRKVYIIDEVHMLTLEAFNALLKTLEEPPEHALFILATTEAHKVPETIASRCVRLAFPRAAKPEVRRSLDRVVNGEKLKAEDEALDLLAGGVDGSFREAVKILEQLSLTGKKITLEKVKEELGRSEGLSGEKLLNLLAKYETKVALQEIERLETLGVNWAVVVAQMIEAVRQQLLVVLGVEPQEKAVVVLAALDENTLLHLADALLGAARRMRTAEISQLPLEMMVVRWGERKSKMTLRLSGASPFDSVQDRHRTRSAQPLDSARDLRDDKLALKSLASLSSEKKEEPEIVVPERVKEEMGRAGETPSGAKKVSVILEDITARWGEVLTAVRPHNHSVEGLLRSTRPVEVTGDTLIVEVFYQFHLDQLKQERFMQIVEGALGEVFANTLRLRYRLGERAARPRREATLENISAEVMDEDVVKVAEEVFGVE